MLREQERHMNRKLRAEIFLAFEVDWPFSIENVPCRHIKGQFFCVLRMSILCGGIGNNGVPRDREMKHLLDYAGRAQ